MDRPIPVGIVHASRLIREELGGILGRQAGVQVVGVYGNARDVLQGPHDGEQILIYDLVTAQQDGAALFRELRERVPAARLLIFNVLDDDQTIVECVQAGASGCILHDASLSELLDAVRSVWQGTPAMSPRCITSLFSYVARLQAGEHQPEDVRLTRREQQMLALIADGLTNKEIAQRLYLRPQTVKNYVHQILQKLELHNRLDLIRLARSGRKVS